MVNTMQTTGQINVFLFFYEKLRWESIFLLQITRLLPSSKNKVTGFEQRVKIRWSNRIFPRKVRSQKPSVFKASKLTLYKMATAMNYLRKYWRYATLFLITVIHMITARYWWTNQGKFNVKGKLLMIYIRK